MQSTIRAFQKILPTYRFEKETSWPEGFAIKRFLKKMEIPDDLVKEQRKQKCFQTYLDFDRSLVLPARLPSNWYKARILIHSMFKDFKLGPVDFTTGSEAKATRGFNSIESKLQRSKWECTPDAFELWADSAYNTLAIKRATRARFSAKMKHIDADIRSFHKTSWSMFRGLDNASYLCFRRMLSEVTYVREASRFSTVRKNNEKDRPIDIQPLCNILVQRRIGNGLRALLRGNGVDLDSLAAKHRLLIRKSSFATIDLQNASDSIHIDLVRFLFPARFFGLVSKARCPYIEGLDGDYYITNKVSSMGNGFTFELMTVILRALGLQHDDSFSVFGDDIITKNESAPGVIQDLIEVGFVVNVDKTFINSPFRESCGGNYHDEFGYIESYDFEYPHDIHDCVVLSNKAFALSLKYPQFKKLSSLLLRAVPRALHGPRAILHGEIQKSSHGGQGFDQDINLSTTFWSKTLGGSQISDPILERKLRAICYDPSKFRLIQGFAFRPELASPTRNHIRVSRSIGKYMMYLHGGRKTKDVITGRGSWQTVGYLSDGKVLFRAKSLIS